MKNILIKYLESWKIPKLKKQKKFIQEDSKLSRK